MYFMAPLITINNRRTIINRGPFPVETALLLPFMNQFKYWFMAAYNFSI